MTFVFTPQTMWALIHSRSSIVFPYLWSNHFANRLVEKPDESTANAVSTAARGRRRFDDRGP